MTKKSLLTNKLLFRIMVHGFRVITFTFFILCSKLNYHMAPWEVNGRTTTAEAAS